MANLSAYTTKRCPLAIVHEVAPPPGVSKQEVEDPFTRSLAEAGDAFEAQVYAELKRLHGPAVADLSHRRDGPYGAHVAATTDALDGGATAVLEAALPTGPGRRSGRCDVLVRADDGGWRPVDVKNHKVVAPEAHAKLGGLRAVSLRDVLASPSSVPLDEDRGPRAERDDLTQLAHYRFMLEEAGLASDIAWGGIIGRDEHNEPVLVWHRLDVAMFKSWRTVEDETFWTALQWNDEEHRFRLERLERAERGEPHGLEPAWFPKWCPGCGWQHHCVPTSERRDSPSLLPNVAWEQRVRLRNGGLETRGDIAGLDWETAQLAGVNFAELAKRLSGAGPAKPITKEARFTKPEREAAAALDLSSVGDLARVLAQHPPSLAKVRDLKTTVVRAAVDEARVAVTLGAAADRTPCRLPGARTAGATRWPCRAPTWRSTWTWNRPSTTPSTCGGCWSPAPTTTATGRSSTGTPNPTRTPCSRASGRRSRVCATPPRGPGGASRRTATATPSRPG